MFRAQASGRAGVAAIKSIAPLISYGSDMLRAWVRRAETDSGHRDSVTTAGRDRIKMLECKNRQLQQANEILKNVSAYLAPALVATSGDCHAEGRSSTAHFRNDPVYQGAPGGRWGQAYLPCIADRLFHCPTLHLLSKCHERGRSMRIWLSKLIPPRRQIVPGVMLNCVQR